MKKFIRFVVILLLVVVTGILILGLYEPKDIIVTRTIMIKAPKEVVFEQIVKFKNWPNWCPWYIMDSGKMKMTYYGTDGQPGSGYTWEGNKTGAGDIRDSAVNGTQMTYVLNIIKPQEKTSWGDLKAEDSAGMTKVTWTLHIHFPFPFNAVLVRLNMDKLMGNDFEDGLNYMKTYIESPATAISSAPGIEIKEVDYPAHVYEGIRSTVSMADMMKYFDNTWDVMTKQEGKKIIGPYSAIMYTWDTVQKNSDMMVCFPVSDTADKVKDASFIYVPASKAVMAVQKGGYEKSVETHMAIGKYMADKGLTHSLVIEEYIISKHEDTDSNKWITNIYYLIK